MAGQTCTPHHFSSLARFLQWFKLPYFYELWSWIIIHYWCFEWEITQKGKRRNRWDHITQQKAISLHSRFGERDDNDWYQLSNNMSRAENREWYIKLLGVFCVCVALVFCNVKYFVPALESSVTTEYLSNMVDNKLKITQIYRWPRNQWPND